MKLSNLLKITVAEGLALSIADNLLSAG